jgi:hypothetical protein
MLDILPTILIVVEEKLPVGVLRKQWSDLFYPKPLTFDGLIESLPKPNKPTNKIFHVGMGKTVKYKLCMSIKCSIFWHFLGIIIACCRRS